MKLISLYKASKESIEPVLQEVMDRMPTDTKSFVSYSKDETTVSKIKKHISDLLHQVLDERNELFNVKFGDVFCAYNIGNNKRYPIILQNHEKEIQFGYVHINNDMFGRENVVFGDNNDEKVTTNIKYDEKL